MVIILFSATLILLNNTCQHYITNYATSPPQQKTSMPIPQLQGSSQPTQSKSWMSISALYDESIAQGREVSKKIKL